MKPVAVGRIEAIDWLRGLAALWVLSYHANLIVMSEKYFGARSLGQWAEWGHHGVEVFFVLSGFVIALTVPATARNDWAGMRVYVVRRLFRIFPAYWAVFVPLAMVGLLTGLGAPGSGSIADYLLANVALFPRDDLTSYIPVVAWTLSHELMFYALFAIAFIRRSLAVGLITAWALASLAFAMTGTVPDGWEMPLSPLNALFLLGIGLARMTPRHVLQVKGGVIGRALDWLGQRSYGLYLVHYPIIVAIAMLLTRLEIGWWALPPLSVVLSLFVASALYSLIERPGIRLGRLLSGDPAHPAVVEGEHGRFPAEERRLGQVRASAEALAEPRGDRRPEPGAGRRWG